MIVVNQRDFGRFRSERRLKLLGKILIFVKSDGFSWDFRVIYRQGVPG